MLLYHSQKFLVTSLNKSIRRSQARSSQLDLNEQNNNRTFNTSSSANLFNTETILQNSGNNSNAASNLIAGVAQQSALLATFTTNIVRKYSSGVNLVTSPQSIATKPESSSSNAFDANNNNNKSAFTAKGKSL